MKAKEITMQIVKNLGNYEACRLQCVYTLDEEDDIEECFVTARKQLEKAFAESYYNHNEHFYKIYDERKAYDNQIDIQTYKQPDKQVENQPNIRKELALTGNDFERVCKALAERRTNIEEVKKF